MIVVMTDLEPLPPMVESFCRLFTSEINQEIIYFLGNHGAARQREIVRASSGSSAQVSAQLRELESEGVVVQASESTRHARSRHYRLDRRRLLSLWNAHTDYSMGLTFRDPEPRP
jgi:DNA-binding HxlR family transcriptional regulator